MAAMILLFSADHPRVESFSVADKLLRGTRAARNTKCMYAIYRKFPVATSQVI